MNHTVHRELIKSEIISSITYELTACRIYDNLTPYTTDEISKFIAINQYNIEKLINHTITNPDYFMAYGYAEDEQDEEDFMIYGMEEELYAELYKYIDLTIATKLDQIKSIKRELLENSAKITMNPNRINRLIECGQIDIDNIESLYDI